MASQDPLTVGKVARPPDTFAGRSEMSELAQRSLHRAGVPTEPTDPQGAPDCQGAAEIAAWLLGASVPNMAVFDASPLMALVLAAVALAILLLRRHALSAR